MSYPGFDSYSRNMYAQHDPRAQPANPHAQLSTQRAEQRQEAQSQVQNRRAVDFGHPREEVVEGQRIYSRHTLLLWGAHKSDISPVNGNIRDGCDSLIYTNEADTVPRTKDDLMFLQFKCSLRNGGGALFSNYQKSQTRNAPHSFPVRVFRKATTAGGITGLRYDGLYHVAAVHDDRGRPRSEPSNSSKTFSFLFKRNNPGQNADQNRFMVEELWDFVQQGRQNSTSPPPLGGVATGQLPMNDGQRSMNIQLRLPPLGHTGGVPSVGGSFRGGIPQRMPPQFHAPFYGEQNLGILQQQVHQQVHPASLQQRAQSMPVHPWTSPPM